jgi:hypothetical protein
LVVTGDTSAITLALQNGTGGAVLSGTNPVNAVNGVATFSVSVNLLGTGYTLHATDGVLTAADSTAFDITAGAPASISFAAGPADAVAGAANNAPTGIIVHVQDVLGNPVAGESIGLTVASGPAAAFTSITSPLVSDASGDASFADAVLTLAGTYTLSAADGALTVTSNSFVITPAAAQLVFTTQPLDVAQGSTLNAIAVTKQDAYGNVYLADTDQIDFTVSSCGGFTLGSANLSGGVATLSSAQRFYSTAAALQITAQDSGAGLTALSNPVAVIASADFLFADGYEGCRP